MNSAFEVGYGTEIQENHLVLLNGEDKDKDKDKYKDKDMDKDKERGERRDSRRNYLV